MSSIASLGKVLWDGFSGIRANERSLYLFESGASLEKHGMNITHSIFTIFDPGTVFIPGVNYH